MLLPSISGVAEESWLYLEKPGILEDQEIDALVTVKLADAGNLLLDVAPLGLFCRQDVYRAARCLIQHMTSANVLTLILGYVIWETV